MQAESECLFVRLWVYFWRALIYVYGNLCLWMEYIAEKIGRSRRSSNAELNIDIVLKFC